MRRFGTVHTADLFLNDVSMLVSIDFIHNQGQRIQLRSTGRERHWKKLRRLLVFESKSLSLVVNVNV